MKKPLRSDAGIVRKPEYRALNPTRKRLYRCICTRKSCRQRTTLAKHPGTYVRGPRLCHCGARYRADWARTLGRESRRNNCECPAAHYPHRKGWCAKVAATCG